MAKSRTRQRRRQLRARDRSQLSCPRYIWFEEQPAAIAASAPPVGTATIAAAAATDGATRLRSFTMEAYRGGRMRPAGFSLPVVVDLAGVGVAAGDRPSFLLHDTTKIVGHIQKIAIDRSITCAGVISGVGEAAQEVVRTADNGFPWRASIGGPIEKLVYVEDGETAQANGQTFTGPLFVIRQMTIVECSFVPLAGDDTSEARILAGRAGNQELKGSTMNFAQWLAAKGFSEADLSDQQRQALRAMFDAEQQAGDDGDGTPAQLAASGDANSATGATTATTPSDADSLLATRSSPPTPQYSTPEALKAALAQASAAELSRQAEIRQVCAQYGVTEAHIGNQRVQLEAHAIAQRWDRNRTELEAMRAARPQTGPAVHDGQVGRELMAQALEASICLSHSIPPAIAADGIPEQAMNLATGRRLRALGLHALMHETIRAAGGYYRPGQNDDEFIRTALRADAQLRAAGNSTISLSGILSNTAYKRMLAAYQAVPQQVHDLASRANHKDFKPVDGYRMTGLGIFKKVGEDGQIDSMELGEDKYTNQVDSYGRILALSYQKIKNDDLSAFMDIFRIMGRGAALALLEATYTLINNGVTANFFSAGNKNYFSGAATNLQISSLKTALQKFRDQVDADGKPVSIEPTTLAVGTALEVDANQLFTDAFVVASTTADKPLPSSNPFKGRFKPHVAPQLSNTTLGGTATGWGIFADPNDVAAICIAYLDGMETPSIEFSQSDFDTLGMKWRGTFHFGVAYGDPKGAVWSKGAA